MDFNKTQGLIPAVIQDWKSGEVLMVGFLNQEAWEKTLHTRKMHFFSRSRQKIWMKGESSGHIQKVHSVWVDCDLDTVVCKVEQLGQGTCHEGYRSCFFREVNPAGEATVHEEMKRFDPQVVYAAKP